MKGQLQEDYEKQHKRKGLSKTIAGSSEFDDSIEITLTADDDDHIMAIARGPEGRMEEEHL